MQTCIVFMGLNYMLLSFFLLVGHQTICIGFRGNLFQYMQYQPNAIL